MEWLDLAIPQTNINNSYYFYNPNHVGTSTLENIGGHTCFLNSVVQCLAHTPPLVNFILKGNYDKNDKLFYQFSKLIKNMLYGDYKLTPIDFYLAFRFDFKKNNNQQEDAHEILLFLLDKFHEVLKYPVIFKDFSRHALNTKSLLHLKDVEMSAINNIFLGQLHQRTQCQLCSHTSHTFPIFKDIVLSLKITNEYQNIYHLLDNFIKREVLEDEFECTHCNKKAKGAYQKTTIWRLPQILIITLKRFKYVEVNIPHVGRQYVQQKIYQPIDYPLRDLDLINYVTNPEKNAHIYNLINIIIHTGNNEMGHYYTINNINHSWVILNDAHLDYINRNDEVISPNAYILFYQRTK
jgi:ubiquitin C-terminal hydrolase